jgi:hypothetical protein
MHAITIVTPVKNPPNIKAFIEGNSPLFKQHLLVVIDSGGGEELKQHALVYRFVDLQMHSARKLGYGDIRTPFTLNLDADTVLPPNFILDAQDLLESGSAAVVALDYEQLQGHYAFGASLWRSHLLKELYDYSSELAMSNTLEKIGPSIYARLNNGWCECSYMWKKLLERGHRLETLPMRAIHLR